MLARPALAAGWVALLSLASLKAETRPERPVRRQPAKPALMQEERVLTEVVDIERLRIVQAVLGGPAETGVPRATQKGATPLLKVLARGPQAIPTCDVLVMGGGLGGVAAAETLARQGVSVIVAEPTSRIGGQLTSQAVPCPDENSYIEKTPGSGTRTYRQVRAALRAYYRAHPRIVPGKHENVGGCWVSRISGEPAAWESVLRDRLQRLSGPGGIRDIRTRNQVVRVEVSPEDGRFRYADLLDLDSGRVTRVAARYLLDASETGEGLALAGCPWTLGAEARATYGEPHAPPAGQPDWVQSFTYCFVLKWQPEGPRRIGPAPPGYARYRALNQYSLDVGPDGRNRVIYKVFSKAPHTGGPFWTYRRLLAAASFNGQSGFNGDLALINWPGNDYHEENFIGKSPEEQVAVLRRGRDFALGFVHWLQTECPRDDGGRGYPEMQLDREALGTEDGLAPHPYIRESRRLLAKFILTENHLAADPSDPAKRWGEEFFDTVGTALYSMDVHPARGEPAKLVKALPYHIPLGSFLTRSGPPNVLPAAKNLGASRMAMASARMHPTEWLIGEVAGHLAAYCVRKGVEPPDVRARAELLKPFQAQLEQAGIPLRWRTIIPVSRGPEQTEEEEWVVGEYWRLPARGQ